MKAYETARLADLERENGWSPIRLALDRYDDRSTIFYNLACAEAQLGEVEAALEHLRSAITERPSLAGDAGEDSDLEPIRDDPRFDEIVGAA